MTKYSAAEGTKTKLINASGELAAELGFDNISTRAVAERSGENIGSIHYHFGGKDGLFEAVVKTAIADFVESPSWQGMAQLEAEDVSPQQLSELVREMIQRQITLLFRTDKPNWHSQVIYQLLQYEGPLYDIFEREILKPDSVAMLKFFRVLDPEISEEEAFLRNLIVKMPIFSHANYMSTILKRLKMSKYSERYLQIMEDLVVRQTQLLLGLPVD
ncbi:TetR/AcrR family transcriptional regulator [Pontiella sulfatireligans]|uniref:Putative HTH-type transcriptional regulator YbiH n=1 Tax=Pontiella sulfatireligans TaxID=2750658 RepID=A0A6C2ULZ4_9BACT|nr:TetR family transcriptional regulator [Pontiella sulfatireligans]VGO21138.1 putative HTH-type transcriptional regulator YbiH [Pontiella sulfatireligans]